LTDTTIEGLQRDIRLFQKEMESLRSQLQTKDSHLHGISREKDALQNQLDEKTTQLEDLKSKYREEKYQLDRLESSKSSQDQRVQDCLNEISLLQNRLREAVTELEKVKSRVDAEKKINREVRQENMTLKEDVYKISTDSEGKDDQIKDLRSNIRTYVTEVKRIEDLLTSREQERGELLEQYKYLSDEVDKSEMHRRQLESQITNLRLDLSTRSAELRATESRLADMEQDLIELSLANESYRSQVATLTTKYDLVDTELKAVKSHTTWSATELTDFQNIATQLDEEKLALQRQISEQAQEIELLNGEILTLRQEITKLTSIMEEEKSSINEQKRELRNTTETDKDRRA
jgi:predicted  nucleic acid-binding Zn-ribbon protein